MSGTIVFPPNPTDGQLYTAGGSTWVWHANPGVWAPANTGTNFLALSGGTMTGAITLPGNAATALQAVPLQQVVPIAGGVTMTGLLTLSGNAATSLQAVPLQQANSIVAPAFDNIGRNLLHNGLFNIQQRGNPGWNATGYTADRWLVNTNTDTIGINVPPQGDTGRAAIGDESIAFVFQNIFTGTVGGYNYAEQRIENVRRLAGKTVTLSFWALSSAPTLRLGANLAQFFGTGGSPSAQVNVAGQAVTIGTTNTWAPTRFALTFVMPSVSGMTLGTNNDHYTALHLWFSAGSVGANAGNIGQQSGTIAIAGVQLEVGSVATPLEKLDPRLDLANCQRFYTVGSFWMNQISSIPNGQYGAWIAFPTTMRAAPTGALLSISYVNASGANGFNLQASGLGVYALATAANQTSSVQCNYAASADL